MFGGAARNNACNFPRFESCMLEAESDTAALVGTLGATVCESLYECCTGAESFCSTALAALSALRGGPNWKQISARVLLNLPPVQVQLV